MDMTPRFHTLWAINGALDQFRAAGFDGVVWHPRFTISPPTAMSSAPVNSPAKRILPIRLTRLRTPMSPRGTFGSSGFQKVSPCFTDQLA